jgi:glycosyltransferase involved in cell wall biosynthesis
MKLKVLHINANSAGGAFVVAQRLHEALNLREDVISKHLVFDGKPGNYELWANNAFRKVIALGNHALDKLDFLRYEVNASIRFQFNHASRGIDISNHPLVLEADIIHFHWVHKGFLSFKGLEKLLRLDKKFIWTCHDLWPVTGGCYYTWGCNHLEQGCFNCKFLKHPSNPDHSTRWYSIKQRLWGSGQVRFITPSRWLAEIGNTSKLMQSPQMKSIKAIPNAINTDFFKPVDLNQKKELKLKFGLNPELPVIMFSAANLNNPAKGFKHFLQVMKGLVQHRMGVQFLIVGREFDGEIEGVNVGEIEGDYDSEMGGVSASEIDAEVNSKFQGKPDSDFPAKYMGFQTDVHLIVQYYQLSDIYVTTAVEDNLPTTVMEALSCGLPCFGFEVGGIPELIDSGLNGFVFNSGDVNSLVDSIITTQDRWRHLSVAAREKALSIYDTKVVVSQIMDEYRML